MASKIKQTFSFGTGRIVKKFMVTFKIGRTANIHIRKLNHKQLEKVRQWWKKHVRDYVLIVI